MQRLAKRLWKLVPALAKKWSGRWFSTPQQQIDALYALLYHVVHDLDHSPSLISLQTQAAFKNQWQNLKEAHYLLSDPWFKENVTHILCEQELLLKPGWFPGKQVLDAGCGNGRWSYGFGKLGAEVTSVDVNEVAIEETRAATVSLPGPRHFVVTPLERLSHALPAGKSFDLVFCWGVAHHCQSFNQVLRELVKLVKDGGILYLYLYGRESLSFDRDLALFKERVGYNVLADETDKYRFLLEKAEGDKDMVHHMHDIFAPLINRRLTFAQVKTTLESLGLHSIIRTIDHTELFIRAFKGNANALDSWTLPRATAPFWFQHHDQS